MSGKQHLGARHDQKCTQRDGPADVAEMAEIARFGNRIQFGDESFLESSQKQSQQPPVPRPTGAPAASGVPQPFLPSGQLSAAPTMPSAFPWSKVPSQPASDPWCLACPRFL